MKLAIPHNFTTWWWNIWYFKLRLIDLTEFIALNILRFTRFGCKDIWIRKSEFVEKTIYWSLIQCLNFVSNSICIVFINFDDQFDYLLIIHQLGFDLTFIIIGFKRYWVNKIDYNWIKLIIIDYTWLQLVTIDHDTFWFSLWSNWLIIKCF